MSPREVNVQAMKSMSSMNLQSARPPRLDPETHEVIPGDTIPGSIPHRDIPHQEFPRVVYLHPKKPFKKMLLPVDGHGNKEWQWVPNQVKSLVVATKEDLETALKQGYKLKHYVVPPAPIEEPEEDLEPIAKQ